MAKLELEIDEEPLKIRIGAMRLEPNDTIVARTDLMLDKDQIRVMRDRLQEFFPNHRVLFLTCGVTIGVAHMVDEDNLER